MIKCLPNVSSHIPLYVKPIQLKKGGVIDAKVIIFLKYYKSGICYLLENYNKLL